MQLGIEVLTVRFALYGSRSLKEKRHRMHGLAVRLGRNPNLAVVESGLHDQADGAQWSFVAAASNGMVAARMLDEVERSLADVVEAVVVDRQRERL